MLFLGRAHTSSMCDQSVTPISHSIGSRYNEIFDCLEENGIVPSVTFHHFVHPGWFQDLGLVHPRPVMRGEVNAVQVDLRRQRTLSCSSASVSEPFDFFRIVQFIGRRSMNRPSTHSAPTWLGCMLQEAIFSRLDVRPIEQRSRSCDLGFGMQASSC